MPSFKDNQGREWLIRIDVSAIRRVRSKYGIDLANVFSDSAEIDKLQSDVCATVDVIHELVIDQATTLGVTPEQFGQSLAGDSLEAACEAFVGAALDFLPQSKRRLLQQVVDGQREIQTQAERKFQTAIDQGLIRQGVTEAMESLDRILASQKPSGSTS